MATHIIAENLPLLKQIALGMVGHTLGGKPAVLSTDIAEHFGKKHKHVLREIERLCVDLPEEFRQPNFGQSFRETETGNGTVRRFPAYLLTRDAFSLLVMGFTGAAALRWKLKYIEAFNALEAEALHHHADLAREAGYMQGRDEALALPQAEAARKQAYLQGLQEGERRQKQRDTGELYRRITAWRQKGLNWEECSLLAGYAKGSGGARRLCRRMERAVARATQEPTAEVTHV